MQWGVKINLFLDALISNPANAYASILNHGFLNHESFVSVKNFIKMQKKKKSNESQYRLIDNGKSVLQIPE